MLIQPKIFISYATPDRERVVEVYNFLLADGYLNVWIDFKKILGGQRWEFEIRRNLQKADIILVFFSKNSVARRSYVQKELKMVINNLQEKLIEDIYIIPVKLDSEVDTPELLTDLQWIDINTVDSYAKIKESIDAQTEKLGLDKPQNASGTTSVQIVNRNFKEIWDGIPGYDIEYTIPVFSSNEYQSVDEITKIVEAKLIDTLHEYRGIKMNQMPELYSWMQGKFMRTNVYDASYGSIYQSYNLISFHYTIYWNGASAAHPNYEFKTYNFFLEPLLPIGSIKNIFEFNNNSDELDREIFEQLTNEVRKKLIEEYVERINNNPKYRVTKGNLDKDIIERIESGTKSWSDFDQFTFSDQGITIYFHPYQISSYSMGAFVVDIPYNILPGEIKRIFRDALPI